MGARCPRRRAPGLRWGRWGGSAPQVAGCARGVRKGNPARGGWLRPPLGADATCRNSVGQGAARAPTPCTYRCLCRDPVVRRGASAATPLYAEVPLHTGGEGARRGGDGNRGGPVEAPLARRAQAPPGSGPTRFRPTVAGGSALGGDGGALAGREGGTRARGAASGDRSGSGGACPNGAARNGAARNGAARNRAPRNETARNRAPRNETARKGAPRNRTARKGAPRNRTARNGAPRGAGGRGGGSGQGAARGATGPGDGSGYGVTGGAWAGHTGPWAGPAGP